MDKQIINDIKFGEERALYNLTNATVTNCRFCGEEDGESALKECSDIDISDCSFELRYPLWHTKHFTLNGSTMTDTCRAALWYAKSGKIDASTLNGIKCLRECDDISIDNCSIDSPEFGWKCRDIAIRHSSAKGEYMFFDCRDLIISDFVMDGKYSFQYVQKLSISNSTLNTKDAFWHARDVVVKDSVINGEYLGWYSDGLTLINCKIKGTQPLCYCKNLQLINCTLEDCDFSFEYSDVEADINGNILSVKNPASGHITADSIGEIITENSVIVCDCKIEIK